MTGDQDNGPRRDNAFENFLWSPPGALCAVFMAAGLIVMPLVLSEANNVEYDPESRETSAEIIGADEHLRGSVDLDGSGGFLGWSFDGAAKLSGDAGRLSVTASIADQNRHFDMEVPRSRYLALRAAEDSEIALTAEFLPCDVPEVDAMRVCYRLREARTGSLIDTSADFTAHVAKLFTDYDTDVDAYHSGWWLEGYARELTFNGYLPRAASERWLEGKRERMDL